MKTDTSERTCAYFDTNKEDIYRLLCCPDHQNGALRPKSDHFFCEQCNKQYPVQASRVVFDSYPENFYTRPVTEKERWTLWRRLNFDYFRNHLEPLPKDRVLVDLGAGPSDFREIVCRFQTYVGVDLYPYQCVSVVADVTKPLPLRNGSADIVYCSNLFEHVSEPQQLMRECNRILKKGGMIIGTVPFFLEVHHAPHDFYRYTYCMLEKLLADSGFSRIFVESLGNPIDAFEVLRYFIDGMLIKQTKAHPIRHLFARVSRKLSAINTRYIMRKFLAKHIPSSPGYTLGYGFRAYKE